VVGGIVAGVVALVLVVAGGLIAFLVARSRGGKDEANNDAALQSRQSLPSVGDAGAASHDSRSRSSNYEALALSPHESNYGVVGVAPPQNYDAWSDKLGDNFSPSPDRTDYEDFTKVH
jgi:hypothetical protein